MTDNCLVIGAGGIGSWFCNEIFDDIVKNQIDLKSIAFTIADSDIVDIKVRRYQDFSNEDLGKNKAEIISKRHGFNCIQKRIETEEQLKDFNIIICCVDNVKTRKLVFEHCFKKDKYFIDLRAEGRNSGYYTKDNNELNKLLKTLPDDDTDGSCQLQRDLDKGIIQKCNKVVALKGSQLLLNHLRDIKNLPEHIERI